ncbi:hypothetical protein OROMI_029396 [Orobanche minor]
MDPNIMRFLEEDEDETMHSGADVEAFTAELNRDIEGNASTSPQPSSYGSTALSQGSNQTTPFLPHWQTSTGDRLVNVQTGQDITNRQHPSSQSVQQQHVLEPENRKENTLPHNPLTDASLEQQDDGKKFPLSNPMATQTSLEQPLHIQETESESNLERESHAGTLQSIGNCPVMAMAANNQRPSSGMVINHNQHAVMGSGLNNKHSMTGSSHQQPGSTLRLNKQVPFGMLLPIIQPQLDKDRAMQLHTLYFKLKKNEISKDDFIRHMRSIVGDHMLKMAVYKLQTGEAGNAQTTTNQCQSQPRQMHPSSNGNTREEIHADSQGLQANRMSTSSSGDFSQDRKHPAYPTQGLDKQQHMHLSQTSFPMYSPLASNAASQMRQAPAQQNITGSQLGPMTSPANMLNTSNFDRSHSLGDMKKLQALQQKNGLSSSSMTHVKHEPIDQSIEQRRNTQLSSSHGLSSLSHAPIRQGSGGPGVLKDESFEMPASRTGFGPSTSIAPTNSTSSSIPAPVEPNILSHPRSITSPICKAAPKKPLAGQKKPMEAPGSAPPSSKKQKVTGAFLDQSIEHLNDVTAVSGVNLREEEEQLFSGSKEDSRVSEASRRVVQEEEDRLILNKIPLQKKVVEIMAKCGLKNMSNDVERCLSLCVEDRMRGLISNLIRLSKQRVDFEKPRHKTIVTSDVRQQIMAINREAREECEKKQAETEMSRKPNESEYISGVDGDKEKDESRAKSTKANKEEDDKLRATAANVAVRAATGVGDMLSRWQLMIEARQTQGGPDTSSGPQPGKDVARKPSAISTKNMRENQEAEKRDPSAATPVNGYR